MVAVGISSVRRAVASSFWCIPRGTGGGFYPSFDGITPSFGRVFPSWPGLFPSQTNIFRSPLGEENRNVGGEKPIGKISYPEGFWRIRLFRVYGEKTRYDLNRGNNWNHGLFPVISWGVKFRRTVSVGNHDHFKSRMLNLGMPEREDGDDF